jgi:murein L,D-transpeptidase YafK
LKRPYLRALLTSAAIAAAIGLAGCDTDSVMPNGRAQAPLSERLVADISSKNMDKNSPILVRLFKEESELEVWKKNRDGEFALLKTYPICKWSGDLGPKKKEGDRQAPEGFYTITPGQMNPASNYFLAFNTGYPNAYDRSWGYTGSELMVHGDCSSRGCYAMTDEQIQEIYALGRESFFGGQRSFQLQAFPFRMTALNMAKHRNNPNFAFWKMIKEGYDHFEASRQEPKVAVCERRYVFDPASPDNASRPLKFDARGKCPVYELDQTIASAVLERQRSEQFQMAEYISRNVAVVPSRHGVDGGMNPVFASKLNPASELDLNGRSYQTASATSYTVAPGALPRTASAPAAKPQAVQQAPEPEATEPMAMTSVRLPQPAPQAKTGEAPAEKTIVSLIGDLFGGSSSAAQTSTATKTETVKLRGSKTDVAAKSKPASIFRTASASTSNAKPPMKQVEKPAEKNPPEREIRTAYSAPPASSGGLLTGAQPVVPAGTFDSRFSGK